MQKKLDRNCGRFNAKSQRSLCQVSKPALHADLACGIKGSLKNSKGKLTASSLFVWGLWASLDLALSRLRHDNIASVWHLWLYAILQQRSHRHIDLGHATFQHNKYGVPIHGSIATTRAKNCSVGGCRYTRGWLNHRSAIYFARPTKNSNLQASLGWGPLCASTSAY